MAFSHTIGRNWSNGQRSISAQQTFAGDGQVSRDIAVPDELTDLEVNLAIDVSQIKAVFILSDQDVTLETNSAGAPDDTIALKANKPYIWCTDDYDSCLLTVDVTDIYLTNSSGSAATVKVEVVTDSTP